MFSEILVPLDPDDEETDVVSYAMNLADAFGSTVHLIAVTEEPQERDQIRTDYESVAHETLEEIVPSREGVRVEQHVRDGVATEEILGAIRDFDIDLIVMGTQARTGVEKMLLGSVAESVIEESPVPVLIVTPGAELPHQQ